MRCFRGKTSCNPSTCFPKIRMRCSWRLNPQIIRSLVKNVHLTLVQSTLLGFFCCASRQWRRGNMHLIATPPVLDCLSPLGATLCRGEVFGEKPPPLTKNTRCQLAGITHDTCAKPPITAPSQLLQPILDGRQKAAATDKVAGAR